jgi:hypothetical protein
MNAGPVSTNHMVRYRKIGEQAAFDRRPLALSSPSARSGLGPRLHDNAVLLLDKVVSLANQKAPIAAVAWVHMIPSVARRFSCVL